MKYKRTLISVALATILFVSLGAIGVSALSVNPAWDNGSTVKAPAVVGAPVGSGAPAVCSQDGKGLDLFIRGADNALYWKESPDGTTWPSTLTNLGGILASSPGATSPTSGVLDVFVRGTDGTIWWTHTENANAATPTWKWSSLGGQIAPNTGPAACAWSKNGIAVFVQGRDGALWEITTSDGGSHWSWQQSLGGKLISAPAATATRDQAYQIGVFVAGTDHSVWYRHYNSTGWNKWTSVGGTLLNGTSPAAYNWGDAQIGWLVTGTDSHIYRFWAGNSQGYENVGGVPTSSPSAVAKANGFIDVFARGSTAQFAGLYQNSYNYQAYPGGWGSWTAIGGV